MEPMLLLDVLDGKLAKPLIIAWCGTLLFIALSLARRHFASVVQRSLNADWSHTFLEAVFHVLPDG